MNALLQNAIQAAIEGGKEILKVYNTSFAVEYKTDESPLTEADKNAHTAIMKNLSVTNIPMLSEEGKNIPYVERISWKQLWMVDPLDGTKEFVKRNGEFTVNIALIENNYPILGVIYVPVKKELYFANSEIGAFKYSTEDIENMDIPSILTKAEKLPLSSFNSPLSTFKIVASRSHMSTETEAFIKEMETKHKNIELVSMGSSLKICLVAEGSANVYPRFAPTMEWDTAAGHAIAECAGCKFIDYTTQQRMRYNKDNLLNSWFVVE
ncbi:MAG: 3'(2'),5'-bisphosphate nucleotidase CysQ [Flavobacteriales bacterium]|nr:3'(2'),5'-bisphosphate nucleotidase CysQ [Flavobacteriales bacterium]